MTRTGTRRPVLLLGLMCAALMWAPADGAQGQSLPEEQLSGEELARRVEDSLYRRHVPVVLDLGCGRREVLKRLEGLEAGVVSVVTAGDEHVVLRRAMGLSGRARCSLVGNGKNGWIAECEVIPVPVQPEAFPQAAVTAAREGRLLHVVLTATRPSPVAVESGIRRVSSTAVWLMMEELCHWSPAQLPLLAGAVEDSFERANRVLTILSRVPLVEGDLGACNEPPVLVSPTSPAGLTALDVWESIPDPVRELQRALRSGMGDLDVPPAPPPVEGDSVLVLAVSRLESAGNGGWIIDLLAQESGAGFLARIEHQGSPYIGYFLGDAVSGPVLSITWGPAPGGVPGDILMFCSARADASDLLAIDPEGVPMTVVSRNLASLLAGVPAPVAELAARVWARKEAAPRSMVRNLLGPLRANLPECRDPEPRLTLKKDEEGELLALLAPELQGAYRAVVQHIQEVGGCPQVRSSAQVVQHGRGQQVPSRPGD